MSNEWVECGGPARHLWRERTVTALFVLWPLAVAVLWTEYALAPVGVVASANVGTLVSIQGSTVTSTRGYFNVSDTPSAEVGTPLRVIRTNSPWSYTGLRLCTSHSASGAGWCSDLSDGYAGVLSKAPLTHRLRSRAALSAILTAALVLTMFGWVPGFAVVAIGDAVDNEGYKPSSAA